MVRIDCGFSVCAHVHVHVFVYTCVFKRARVCVCVCVSRVLGKPQSITGQGSCSILRRGKRAHEMRKPEAFKLLTSVLVRYKKLKAAGHYHLLTHQGCHYVGCASTRSLLSVHSLSHTHTHTHTHTHWHTHAHAPDCTPAANPRATGVCKSLHLRSVLEAKRVVLGNKVRLVIRLDAEEGHAPVEIGGEPVNTRWSFEYNEVNAHINDAIQETLSVPGRCAGVIDSRPPSACPSWKMSALPCSCNGDCCERCDRLLPVTHGASAAPHCPRYHVHEACTPQGVNPAFCVCAN